MRRQSNILDSWRIAVTVAWNANTYSLLARSNSVARESGVKEILYRALQAQKVQQTTNRSMETMFALKLAEAWSVDETSYRFFRYFQTCGIKELLSFPLEEKKDISSDRWDDLNRSNIFGKCNCYLCILMSWC